MAELKKNLPEGVDYPIVYDPTAFVRDSIEAVVHTLLEAIVLVVLVVILFLQTWRASIIPLLAVPVSIIGTFAVMFVFGFSINALTLFGLVLAIGIVVDDAIVVVENVERNIELGLSPREATYGRWSEVTGPIIAIALVLCAVFVPLRLHQRADRPVLQAVRDHHRDLDRHLGVQLAHPVARRCRPCCSSRTARRRTRLTRAMDWAFGWFFRGFNRVFASRLARAMAAACRRVICRKALMLGVYLALVVADLRAVQRGARRASCRCRTSSTWSPSRSCPTAPRSTAPRR